MEGILQSLHCLTTRDVNEDNTSWCMYCIKRFKYSSVFCTVHPRYSACIVGIYKVALTHKKLGITKELLANKVVPFLFPLCIDSGLNLTQVSLLTVLLHEQQLKLPCGLLGN